MSTHQCTEAERRFLDAINESFNRDCWEHCCPFCNYDGMPPMTAQLGEAYKALAEERIKAEDNGNR